MKDSAIEIDPDYAERSGSRVRGSGTRITNPSSSVASFVGSSLRLLNAAASPPRPFARQISENGQLYDANGANPAHQSGEEHEMSREDRKHRYCSLVMDDQLHLAPIGGGPAQVLDLGTGNGNWCVDMALRHPHARIFGTDLSIVTPIRLPPNVTFEIEDFDDDWTFNDDTFDLVHHRFNMIAVAKWPQQFRKAFAVLKPGGFIEVIDIGTPPQSDDKSIPVDSQLVRFFELVTDGCRQLGKDMKALHRWRTQFEDTGFVNVQERILKVPIGGWPKYPRLKEAGLLRSESLKVRILILNQSPFTPELMVRSRSSCELSVLASSHAC